MLADPPPVARCKEAYPRHTCPGRPPRPVRFPHAPRLSRDALHMCTCSQLPQESNSAVLAVPTPTSPSFAAVAQPLGRFRASTFAHSLFVCSVSMRRCAARGERCASLRQLSMACRSAPSACPCRSSSSRCR